MDKIENLEDNEISYFDGCWDRIVQNEGNQFYTISGLQFKYRIIGNHLLPSRTDYNISKKDFEKVFKMGRLKGPGEISNEVRGSAYVWAIMHDSRIRS